MIDKKYCMSHYLAFRYVSDPNLNFLNDRGHQVYEPHSNVPPILCRTADDVGEALRRKIEEGFIPGKTALLLSGGIDSAILASYLPKGTKVYTFQSDMAGAIDETEQAAKYARAYELDHEIIRVTWEDFETLTDEICRFQNVPVHSIEIMFYKAAMHARSQGMESLMVGEGADLNFGGMDKMLSRDWLLDDFISFYTFVDPAKVLKDPQDMRHVYERYRLDGDRIDFMRFMEEVYSIQSSTSFMHPFCMAGVKHYSPYSFLAMAEPLDLERVRRGDSKYRLRELFAQRYPDIPVPNKIPMPRAMDQWLADWEGPSRPEFLPGCAKGMKGDQKWLIWCLERYLNVMEQEH